MTNNNNLHPGSYYYYFFFLDADRDKGNDALPRNTVAGSKDARLMLCNHAHHPPPLPP